MEHFHKFLGHLQEHSSSFGIGPAWAWRFLSILIYFLSRPSKLSLTNLGMSSIYSVCSQFMFRVLKSYVLMNVTLPWEFSSETKSYTSSEFWIYQYPLIPEFLYIASLFTCCRFLTRPRHVVSIFETNVVVHLLEAAIKRLPYGVLCNFGNQWKYGRHLNLSGTVRLNPL